MGNAAPTTSFRHVGVTHLSASEWRIAAGFDETGAHNAGGSSSTDSTDQEIASVLAAIRQLPETYRETLLLRLVEGMTGPEIAARTGLTRGSVRVNLHRGMQQLRELLARGTREKSALEKSAREEPQTG